MKKEFHDADCDDDPDQVGEDADRNQISCPLNPHCTQVNCQHVKGRLRAPHDDRRNQAGQGIRTVGFDDIREYAQRSTSGQGFDEGNRDHVDGNMEDPQEPPEQAPGQIQRPRRLEKL